MIQAIFETEYRESDDLILIDQAQEGSRKALEQLLERHYNFIYNVALRFLLNPQDAQDLTQEVLIKLITKLRQFHGKSSFRTWLYRMVVNHFLNSKRGKMETAIQGFDAYGKELDRIPFHELNPEEKLSLQEEVEDARIGCMTGMLLCLDRRQRLVFILGEIFEVKSPVGAELLDISPDNFRKILTRARKDLYNFMNRKCGLLNLNNPCRCPKKTKGFIQAGWVQPKKLQFHADFLHKLSDLSLEKANACDNLIEEKYGALFKDSPYYDLDKSEEMIAGLTKDKELKEIFDLG
ncbi:MAG: RNA polymerase sigma factor [Bacteroidota bacterium]